MAAFVLLYREDGSLVIRVAFTARQSAHFHKCILQTAQMLFNFSIQPQFFVTAIHFLLYFPLRALSTRPLSALQGLFFFYKRIQLILQD